MSRATTSAGRERAGTASGTGPTHAVAARSERHPGLDHDALPASLTTGVVPPGNDHRGQGLRDTRSGMLHPVV
ncbi:hypothetical protein [Micromonospora zamorensis]|uniref:hypothetical protein n=1 Tax=Micromonospora zamorensis TaxID=709883 RepID=UPI003CF3EE90